MNRGIEEAEEQTSDLEDWVMEINHTEPKRENRILQRETRLRELSNYRKDNSIHIVGVPEGRENGEENLFEETIAENFPMGGGKQTSTSRRLENSHQNQQNQANIQTYCKQTCKLQWQ